MNIKRMSTALRSRTGTALIGEARRQAALDSRFNRVVFIAAQKLMASLRPTAEMVEAQHRADERYRRMVAEIAK